ncbi:MAG: VPLPA-CTERM sorting domain-containing protein [Pseudomonadota bacterium]
MLGGEWASPLQPDQSFSVDLQVGGREVTRIDLSILVAPELLLAGLFETDDPIALSARPRLPASGSIALRSVSKVPFDNLVLSFAAVAPGAAQVTISGSYTTIDGAALSVTGGTEVSIVPLPASALLLVPGLAGLLWLRRRRPAH